MNIQVTVATTIAGFPAAAGLQLQIPHELYNEQTMTRLGPNASPTSWTSFIGSAWPFAIFAE